MFWDNCYPTSLLRCNLFHCWEGLVAYSWNKRCVIKDEGWLSTSKVKSVKYISTYLELHWIIVYLQTLIFSKAISLYTAQYNNYQHFLLHNIKYKVYLTTNNSKCGNYFKLMQAQLHYKCKHTHVCVFSTITSVLALCLVPLPYCKLTSSSNMSC